MALAQVVNLVFLVAILLVIARLVIDWVMVFARSWRPTGFTAVLCEAVYSVTDPPLRAIRSVLPPVRLGGAAIDFSPMVLLIGLYVAQAIVIRILV